MMKYDEDYLDDRFKELLKKIDSHFTTFANHIDFSEDPFIDNSRFIQLMNISHKTAQMWRDSGIIGFSQIKNKIYYRVSDIKELLNKYHNEPKEKELIDE